MNEVKEESFGISSGPRNFEFRFMVPAAAASLGAEKTDASALQVKITEIEGKLAKLQKKKTGNWERVNLVNQLVDLKLKLGRKQSQGKSLGQTESGEWLLKTIRQALEEEPNEIRGFLQKGIRGMVSERKESGCRHRKA